MKFYCSTMLMALLAATGLCASAEEKPIEGQLTDGIAATVNGKIITLREVREAVQPIEEEIRKNARSQKELEEKLVAVRLDTLNKLIERELILQAFVNYRDAQGNEARVPEEFIDRRVREIIHNDYDDNQQLFIKTLQGRGTTLSAFREEIRERIIVQFLRDHEVSSNIFISPYKIEQYYKQNQSRFHVEEQVKLRIIFVKKAEENRRPLAEDIFKRLESGGDFAEIAKAFSEDKVTRDRGGDFGWRTKADLPPELATAAFALKAGQRSGVVETPKGYFILLVEETKLAHAQPMAEVRDEIEKILTQQERDRLQREWIERLKRKAYIRYY